MGACEFINVWQKATQNTAKEAFRACVEQAQYDHGHAGYTGTIAEKNEFVRIGSVKTEDEAVALAEKLIEKRDGRIDDKWGPAGMIEINNGKEIEGWCFFGLASS